MEHIADTAAHFLKPWNRAIDLVVSVPPSRHRVFQPAFALASAIATRLAKPVKADVVTKIRATPELKIVFDYAERRKLLDGAFEVDGTAVRDQRILLIDDLYRSGATAAVVAGELQAAGAKSVLFLANDEDDQEAMTTVFIGGSRRLSRLNTEIRQRLDNIIEKGFAVVVGDANGADRAVQRDLADKGYARVTIFCMTGDCRNNVGGWPTKDISAPSRARGFAYYSTKDKAMADAASHGLMLWDGEIKGTLSNIVTMVRQEKPVVVYFAPDKAFHTVRTSADIGVLLEKCDAGDVRRFERDLELIRT